MTVDVGTQTELKVAPPATSFAMSELPKNTSAQLVNTNEKDQVERPAYSIRRLRGALILLIAMSGQFFDDLAATSVVICLPKIQKELGYRDDQLQWIISAYSLAFAGLLPLAGAISDRFGKKKVFITGASILALFNMLSGFAKVPIELIMFRACVGIGASATVPSCLGIVAEYIKKEEQNAAYSFVAAAGASGLGLGTIIAGGFTSSVGWRWTFFFQAPIIASLAVIAFFAVPNDVKNKAKLPPMDIAGAGLVTSGIVLLCFVVSGGSVYGWGSPLIISLLVVSVVLLVAFVWLESKIKHPIMPFWLWKIPNYAPAFVLSMLCMGVWTTQLLYYSQISQDVLGLSPLQTGVRLLPMTFAGILAPILVTVFEDKLPLKPTTTVQSIVICLGTLPLTLMKLNTSFWSSIFVSSIITSAGMSSLYIILLVCAMSHAPAEIESFAGAVITSGFFIGGAVGLAICTAILTATTGPSLAQELEGYTTSSWCLTGYAALMTIIALWAVKNRKQTSTQK